MQKSNQKKNKKRKQLIQDLSNSDKIFKSNYDYSVKSSNKKKSYQQAENLNRDENCRKVSNENA